MNKMNYQEILEKLKENIDSVSNFAFEDYDSKKLGLGEVEEIDQYGGEGEGDHWHSVKHFKEHDIYIKVTGYYQSYNGTEFYGGWGSCSQVFPKQKTIIVYEQL